jgi:hypothetical protein
MDIAPDPASKRNTQVNSTPTDVAATAVAAYWNNNTVPVMNKIQLLKFGRTLELDPTKSLLEKYRLLQEWIVFNESMSTKDT